MHLQCMNKTHSKTQFTRVITILVLVHSIVLKLVKNSVPRVSTGKSGEMTHKKLVPSPATIVSVLLGRRQAVN